jgi:hypothetical protein
MALLDGPFLGFDSLVDALDVAESVFAVKAVWMRCWPCVCAQGLGYGSCALRERRHRRGCCSVFCNKRDWAGESGPQHYCKHRLNVMPLTTIAD